MESISVPREFNIKCTICGKATAAYVAASGHKYCKECAYQKLNHRTHTIIMISLELLQVLRGHLPIPERLTEYAKDKNTGEVAAYLYKSMICHNLLKDDGIAEIVFRKTFHFDTDNYSFIWTNTNLQFELSKMLETIITRLISLHGGHCTCEPDLLVGI